MCSEGERNNKTNTVLEQLVSLTINQDHVAQGWLKFLITIETALIVAFSSVVVLFTKGDMPAWFLRLSLATLPALGIAAAIALTVIILRERKWQAWYVQQIRTLQADPPSIYSPTPEGWSPAKSVHDLRTGYISKVVVGLTVAIVVFWAVVIFAAQFVNLEKQIAGSPNQQVEATRQ